MSPEARQYIFSSIIIGTVAFVMMNFFTNPGWSTDATGMTAEIDRYYGWPCLYYVDTWKRSGDQEPIWGIVMPLFPPPGLMTFNYADSSVMAFLLNLIFFVAATLIVVLIGHIQNRERIVPIVGIVGTIALSSCLLIYLFGDRYYGATL